jgi:hypothetical protein
VLAFLDIRLCLINKEVGYIGKFHHILIPILNGLLMSDNSFFKKTLSYLSALEKGSVNWLMEKGWFIDEEVKRMQIILEKLGLVKIKSTNWIVITDKGLNILSYYENSFEEQKVTRIIEKLVKL